MKLATLVAAAGLAALVLLSTSAAALPLEEEDEFDFEDEFVIDDSDAQAPEVVNVQEPQPTAVAQPSAQTIADKESSPAGTPAEVESRSFILEYLGIAAIVVYVVMFLLGKQKNSALARTWFDVYEPWLTSQFARVGLGAADQNSGLIKESQNHYRLFASGRRNCEGLLVDLMFQKRQDLLSLLMGLVQKSEDAMTLDIPVSYLPPYVMAVVRNKMLQTVRTEAQDLKDFGNVLQENALGLEKFRIITDSVSLTEALLDKQVRAVLNSPVGDYVNMIHFTDQAPLSNIGTNHISKMALRFQFRFPDYSHISDLQPLFDLIPTFIDRMASVRLDPKDEAKNKKRRLKAQMELEKSKAEERREAAQRAKEEKRQERQKNILSLPREQQRKLDEKERKKKLKGSRQRVKIKAM